MPNVHAGRSWIAGIDAALAYASRVTPDHQGALFVVAADAISRAPTRFLDMTGIMPSRADVTRFAQCGAYGCAATEMLGPDAAFMLSRSGSDAYLATVLLPGMIADASAEGQTDGIAILSALLTAIQTLAEPNRSIIAQITEVSLRLH